MPILLCRMKNGQSEFFIANKGLIIMTLDRFGKK